MATENGKVLTKDQLLAIELKMERVDLPEGGEGAYVYVREMTGDERLTYSAGLVKAQGGRAVQPEMGDLPTEMIPAFIEWRNRMLSWVVVDEGQAPILTEDEIAILATKSGSVITKLFTVARRLSGFIEAEEQVEKKGPAVGYHCGKFALVN